VTDRGPSRPDPKGLGSPLPSAMIPDSVECPFCMGTDTEQFAAFGSALSVSQYWCRKCRTVFEWMKWREEESR
jgi:hypothetical protein